MFNTVHCQTGNWFWDIQAQGSFLGEILRDLLDFLPKISPKFVQWEKKSHAKNFDTIHYRNAFLPKMHFFNE
ncbi:MAG: hypothetical protein AB2693_29900 [Candidatus Thiodiazotropha sp.]